MKYIVGIDEVGRGPVAGPVTVCAFIMKSDIDLLVHFKNKKLKDSKKLNDKERRRIRAELNKQKLFGAVDFVISKKQADYIDKKGISLAVQKCIQECLNKLRLLGYSLDEKNTFIHLDGALNIDPDYLKKIKESHDMRLAYDVNVKGDENIPAIACASVLAKVVRDNYMIYLSHKIYDTESKWYNWSSNMGYGTKEHYDLIKKYGITKWHRKTFLKKIL